MGRTHTNVTAGGTYSYHCVAGYTSHIKCASCRHMEGRVVPYALYSSWRTASSRNVSYAPFTVGEL